MPSVSEKQARTMRAAAHDPEFARRMGIDMKVAKEFVEADRRKREREAAAASSRESILVDVGIHPAQE